MKNEKTYNKDLSNSKWERLASVLSGESEPDNDNDMGLLDDRDTSTAKMWKAMDEIRDNDVEPDIDNAWTKLYNRLEKDNLVSSGKVKRHIFSFPPGMLKIAASLLIVTGLGYAALYLLTPKTEPMLNVYSSDKTSIIIDLPDGSKATLNRNTTLTYPSEFGSEKRIIEISGECFFEVTHDPSKPFRVVAGNAAVEVLGTSFNINTRPHFNDIEVFVASGKVQLTDLGSQNSIILTEGYIGTSLEGKQDKYVNTDPNYLSWSNQTLRYESARLETVFADLEKVYGINIATEDTSLLDEIITTVFNNIPEEEVMDIISLTFNLHWKKDDRDYLFSRQ